MESSRRRKEEGWQSLLEEKDSKIDHLKHRVLDLERTRSEVEKKLEQVR